MDIETINRRNTKEKGRLTSNTPYSQCPTNFDYAYKSSSKHQVAPQQQYIPKCPTCQSPDICKIGAGEKIISGAFWGLFSNKIRKTYRCKNCGYLW